MKLRKLGIILSLLALVVCLASCKALTKDLAIVLNEAEFVQLEDYPKLENLDLTGSTCYSAIEDYIAAHPEVNVTYAVYICGEAFSPRTTEVHLSSGNFSLEELLQTLPHLPHVRKVTVSNVGLTPNEIATFQEIYPDIQLAYSLDLLGTLYVPDAVELTLPGMTDDLVEDTIAKLKLFPNLIKVDLMGNTSECPLSPASVVHLQESLPNVFFDYRFELLGQLYTPDTTELTLAGLTTDMLESTIAKLKLFPKLATVDLMGDTTESTLSIADVKMLQEALPGVLFKYQFELFGKTVSTTDTSLEYLDLPIGNEGEAAIREALDILTSCTYFKLDDCGIDNEIMASIRDDYPDVKVVWRVYCGKFSMCTDETMVRMTNGLTDDTCYNLRYCTDVTHMDLGHNEHLTDVSYVAFMPKLECVILSGSAVKDISAFANHENLLFMELVYCGYLKDISALESCTNLKYLNISMTKVTDLSSLEKLPLERFISMKTKVSSSTQKTFKQWHPDCLIRFSGSQPYGYGWRYVDNGQTYNDYYANMRIIFRYDEKSYTNHKER